MHFNNLSSIWFKHREVTIKFCSLTCGPQVLTGPKLKPGSCCCWGHTYLTALHCHPRPWWHLGLACCQGPFWIHGPIRAGICVDVHGPCCHQRPQECLASGPLPLAMLGSEGCAAARTSRPAWSALSPWPQHWLGPRCCQRPCLGNSS